LTVCARGCFLTWLLCCAGGRARLIDVALEQYAFVQLAEAAAHIEGQARSGGVDWRYAAAVTGHALTNAMHSETCDVEEAKSLISESEWVESGGTDMQRVKAWLDRSLRICTSFSDAMQKLFLEVIFLSLLSFFPSFLPFPPSFLPSYAHSPMN
jgi:hypothetical protein